MHYEVLGDLLAGQEPGTEETRKQAIDWYQKAADRYPNSARIRTSLALTLDSAGKTEAAREQAKLALELDDLNQAAMHADKVLPPEKRQRLEQIRGPKSPDAPSRVDRGD